MADNFTDSTTHFSSTQFSISMIIVITIAGFIALVSIALSLATFFCICIDEEKTIKLQTAASIRHSILLSKRRQSSGKRSVTSPKKGSLKTNKKKRTSLKESKSKSMYNNVPSTTSKSEAQFSDVFDSQLKKKKKVQKIETFPKNQSFSKRNLLPNKTLFKSKSNSKSKQKTMGIVWATPNV